MNLKNCNRGFLNFGKSKTKFDNPSIVDYSQDSKVELIYIVKAEELPKWELHHKTEIQLT